MVGEICSLEINWKNKEGQKGSESIGVTSRGMNPMGGDWGKASCLQYLLSSSAWGEIRPSELFFLAEKNVSLPAVYTNIC